MPCTRCSPTSSSAPSWGPPCSPPPAGEGTGARDGAGEGRAGEKLIGVGLAAYGPTALTGFNDWADTEPVSDGVRRAGLVHAVTNLTAMSLYAGWLMARRRGRRGAGAALGAAGAAV